MSEHRRIAERHIAAQQKLAHAFPPIGTVHVSLWLRVDTAGIPDLDAYRRRVSRYLIGPGRNNVRDAVGDETQFGKRVVALQPGELLPKQDQERTAFTVLTSGIFVLGIKPDSHDKGTTWLVDVGLADVQIYYFVTSDLDHDTLVLRWEADVAPGTLTSTKDVLNAIVYDHHRLVPATHDNEETALRAASDALRLQSVRIRTESREFWACDVQGELSDSVNAHTPQLRETRGCFRI